MSKTGTVRRKDITGQIFGQLTVTAFSHVHSEVAYWKCLCSCGKEAVVRGVNLRNGKQKSCSLECQYKRKAESHIGETHGQLTILGIDYVAMENRAQYWYKLECSCGELLSCVSTMVMTGKKTSCSFVCSNTKLNEEYIGQRFGRLEITGTCIALEGEVKRPRAGFICKCDCGVQIERPSKSILGGQIKSCGCFQREYGQSLIGEKNPHWLGGITAEHLSARTSKEYYAWQEAVFERDKYTCQKCGYHNKRGDGMHAHHILNFSSHKEERFLVSNGILFCKSCHQGGFHSRYGNVNNTREQLDEFLKSELIMAVNMEDQPAAQLQAV